MEKPQNTWKRLLHSKSKASKLVRQMLMGDIQSLTGQYDNKKCNKCGTETNCQAKHIIRECASNRKCREDEKWPKDIDGEDETTWMTRVLNDRSRDELIGNAIQRWKEADNIETV